MVCCVFFFVSKYFLITLWFLVWSIDCLRVCCSISTNLWVFQFSFFYWFLTTSCCGLRRYFIWYLSFKIYWNLICGLRYGLSWKMSHVHFRRICLLLLLGRVSCIYLLDLVSLLCCLRPLFPYFCLVVLSIIESRILKSTIITVKL